MTTSEKISVGLMVFCAAMILLRVLRPPLHRTSRYRAAELLMFGGYLLPGSAVLLGLNPDLRSVALPIGAGAGLIGVLWMGYEARRGRMATRSGLAS